MFNDYCKYAGKRRYYLFSFAACQLAWFYTYRPGKPKAALIISIAFLLLYWLLLYAFGDAADPLSMQGNFGSVVDRWLLSEKHLYHGEGVAFDPEGLLSTLPAIANVVAGYAVGKFIQQKGSTYEGLTKLLQ